MLRLSLLRAATYPDPHADQGAHDLPMRCCPTWRLAAGRVIPAGYDLNARRCLWPWPPNPRARLLPRTASSA